MELGFAPPLFRLEPSQFIVIIIRVEVVNHGHTSKRPPAYELMKRRGSITRCAWNCGERSHSLRKTSVNRIAVLQIGPDND
jgi:hypothetical protein